MVLPLYFKQHKKATALISCLVIALLSSNVISNVTYSANAFNENAQMRGHITIKINGVTTYDKEDLIMGTFYDYNICKIWNDTTACANQTNIWYHNNAFSNGCRTYSTNGMIDKPNGFTASTRCTATAMLLSIDTDIPTLSNPALTTILNTNGFSPIKGVTVHSVTQNTLTLTGTWTATGTQANIDKVGIGMWNEVANAWVDAGNSFFAAPYIVFTSDLFTPQTVTNGQTFQIIFTISF